MLGAVAQPVPDYAATMAQFTAMQVVQATAAATAPYVVVWPGFWGIVGDGVADDSAALQAAINTGASIWLAAGQYRVNKTLAFKASGQLLVGAGVYLTTILGGQSAGNVIDMVALQMCGVRDMRITLAPGATAPTGSYAISIRYGTNGGVTASPYRCTVERVMINNLFNGVEVNGATETVIDNPHLLGLTGNCGIKFTGTATAGSYGLWIKRPVCNVQGNGNTSIVWLDFDSYAYSLSVASAALLTGGEGVRMHDTANTGTSYPMWFFGNDVACDHNQSAGISLEAGEGCYITESWVGSCLVGNGIQTVPGWRGEFYLSTSRVMGNIAAGVLLGGGVDSYINGNLIGSNNAGGVGANGVTVAAGLTRFGIHNNRIGPAVGAPSVQHAYGIFIVPGASDYYSITGNDLSGNQYAPLYDGGTGTYKLVLDAIAKPTGVAKTTDGIFAALVQLGLIAP